MPNGISVAGWDLGFTRVGEKTIRGGKKIFRIKIPVEKAKLVLITTHDYSNRPTYDGCFRAAEFVPAATPEGSNAKYMQPHRTERWRSTFLD